MTYGYINNTVEIIRLVSLTQSVLHCLVCLNEVYAYSSSKNHFYANRTANITGELFLTSINMPLCNWKVELIPNCFSPIIVIQSMEIINCFALYGQSCILTNMCSSTLVDIELFSYY